MHPKDDFDGPADSPEAQREMPRYISHKRVWALEIDTVRHPDVSGACRLTFRDKGYAPIVPPAETFLRYKPVPGDFYVVYADGYKSFSPRKAFVEGYVRESGSGFQQGTNAELDAALAEELAHPPRDIARGS
jgi:hypothetical protein